MERLGKMLERHWKGLTSKSVISYSDYMEDDAPCMLGHCDVCALRQIRKTDLSEYSCHGGVDATTFEYFMPCPTCCPPASPSTQDHDNYSLASFLEGFPDPETLFETEEMDLGKLIWGEEVSAEAVFESVMEWQDKVREAPDRWPHVSLPMECEGMSLREDGTSSHMRWYKPFQRLIQKDEEKDFKEFLDMIF